MNVPPSVDRAADGVWACELRLRPQMTIVTFAEVSASRFGGGQARTGRHRAAVGHDRRRGPATYGPCCPSPGATADAATTVFGLLKLLVWLTRTFQVPVLSRLPRLAASPDTEKADDVAPGPGCRRRCRRRCDSGTCCCPAGSSSRPGAAGQADDRPRCWPGRSTSTAPRLTGPGVRHGRREGRAAVAEIHERRRD